MKFNPANCETHIRRCHNQEEAPHVFRSKNDRVEDHIIEQQSMMVNPAVPTATTTATTLSTKSLTSCGFKTSNSVATEHNYLLYKMMSSANMAIKQGLSPPLLEYINFLVDNANFLKNKKGELKMPPEKYKREQLKSMTKFVMVLSRLISTSHSHYKEQTGADSVPFITVGHDGWDSKQHDLMGVSIHFIVPYIWLPVSAAIGLKRYNSKKTVDMVDLINSVLSRFGITSGMVFRGVNDTTNATKKAGRDICQNRQPEGHNSCAMHTQELVLKHAIGLRTRSENTVIVDQFPEGLHLVTKIRKIHAKIMDKKKKHRYVEYQNHNWEFLASESVKLIIPNDTRVSGNHAMLESSLRSKRAIDLFTRNYTKTDVFKPDALISTEEWLQVAEIESVMRGTNILAFVVQTHTTVEYTMTWYSVAFCRAKLKSNQIYKVYDTSKMWKPDTLPKHIPQVKLRRNALHDTTKKFIKRLIDELDTYFPKPDNDMLVAMKLNPLMVWTGFSYLQIIDKENFGTKAKLEVVDNVTIDFVFDLFKDGVETKARKHVQEESMTEVEEDSQEQVGALDSSDEMVEEDDDFLTDLYKQVQVEQTIDASTALTQDVLDQKYKALEEVIRSELQEYSYHCNQITDMVKLLQEHCGSDLFFKELAKKEMLTNKKKRKSDATRDMVEDINSKRDPQRIAPYFDLVQWWKKVGRLRFPHLATAASIMLGKPASNGYQERVFSSGTYYDSNLRKRLKEDHYEMQVLESMNSDLVKEALRHVHEVSVTTEGDQKLLQDFFKKEKYLEMVVTAEDIGLPSSDCIEDDGSSSESSLDTTQSGAAPWECDWHSEVESEGIEI